MENSKIHNQQQGGDEEQKHYSYAMQLALSSVLPMVLGSAVELQVFEIISKSGVGAQLSPSEIASQMPISDNPNAPAMLDRMLRLLASFSIFSCSLQEVDGGGVERRYGLAPVAKYFVRNQDGVSLGALMDLIQGKVFMDSWPELKGAVLEGGIAFDRVHGMHAFDYPGKDPTFNDVFNKAMINHTTIVVKKILETYKGFDGINRVVDVGGGLGVTLSLITSKFPHIKGINFDQPHVIENAPSYPGVEHIGGDMFASVPKGDAIFMKWILHDWSDEHCIKLLKNCHKALPDNGKVIVVEGVLPVLPETDPATKSNSQVDLVMMTQNPGGKERTQDEFLSLALGAGFTAIRNECFVCNFWVMEFLK